MALPPEDKLLPALMAICTRAGEAIMEVYRTEFDIERKDDKSPLTEADLAAHHIIMEGLKSLAPALPRLSEEGASIPFEQRRQWESYWLIDPLDGTREFIKKNGEFTVNIALIRNHVPVLGAIHAPALQMSYYGGAASGAFKQVGNAPARSIRVRPLKTDRPPRILVSRSHRTERQDAFLERLGDHVTMSIGSSLKFCLVAEGEADFYPRLGPTSEWDTAAGQAILEAAGGLVTETDFTPLRYNTKESLLNPDFLVIGDRTFGWDKYFE